MTIIDRKRALSFWLISCTIVAAFTIAAVALVTQHSAAAQSRHNLCKQAQLTRAATITLAKAVLAVLALSQQASRARATTPQIRREIRTFYRKADAPVQQALDDLTRLRCD